ncbi:MAG: type VI secretion system baseplate subunit TssF [Burkholderiales bacterium]
MDPRLLDYYNRELGYFRQLGSEFAEQFPKIAARLGMKGIEVADPYVERLLEGVAFMSARVQLKLDAEFPRFSQRMLEVVCPNYLAPTPAAAVVRFAPRALEASQSNGFKLARGTTLRAQIAKGEQTACEFRTAHEVTLWPLEIAEATLTGAPADLPINRVPVERQVRGAVRLRLRTSGDMPVTGLAIPKLSFFLAGTDDVASRLYELVTGRVCGVLVCSAERPAKWHRFLPASAVEAEGFDDEDALFPYEARGFGGYRLLHEYFAFPQRFQFAGIHGIGDALREAPEGTTAFDIVLLLDRAAPDLERVVDAKQFALYCAPVVNLFTRRSDRIAITPDVFEHQVVLDRGRPLDFEVYAIKDVEGYAPGESEPLQFRPFYGSVTSDDRTWGRYYSMRREPRLLSEKARRQGPRTGYIGSEVFLSLVDQAEAPFAGDLRQVTVTALCTNRDLPLIMPQGGRSDFSLLVSAPVESINILRGPSRPYPSLAEREVAWRLITHLGLNYLALTDIDKERGALSLRRLLELYASLADPATRRQIDGVQGVSVRPVTRRMPRPGPLVFGRGAEIALTLDETAFAGSYAYLMGRVLERFFARHAALNTFTETVVSSLQRGELARFAPRAGERPVI